MYNTNVPQQKLEETLSQVSNLVSQQFTICLLRQLALCSFVRPSDFQTMSKRWSVTVSMGVGDHTRSQFGFTYPISSANGSWKRSPTVETEARDSSNDFAA